MSRHLTDQTLALLCLVFLWEPDVSLPRYLLGWFLALLFLRRLTTDH